MANEHVIQVDGTGFFSKATCTGCDWAAQGKSPDELCRIWESYHAEGKVIPLPDRVPLLPMAEDPKVQLMERRLIQLVAHFIDHGNSPMSRFVALGLAEARAIMLDEQITSGGTYLADMTACISTLSRRQREKLRHPSRDRAAQQEILENG